MTQGKTVGVIQAHMDCGQLPGKILAPLADRPLLDQLFTRVSRSRVGEWWLATSADPSDDVTEAWGFELGLRVHRGQPADLLSRYVAIGRETRAPWLLYLDAGHPFVDAGLIDTLIDARDATSEAKSADLIQHRGGTRTETACTDAERARISPSLPTGYTAQLIRCEAIERVAGEISGEEPRDRTRVTRWLSAHRQVQVYDVPPPMDWPDRPQWRWALDSYKDLAMARSAFQLFGTESSSIDYPTMVARLDLHPEITQMNLAIGDTGVEIPLPEDG